MAFTKFRPKYLKSAQAKRALFAKQKLQKRNPDALTEEDTHNRKVYEGNIGFAKDIMRMAQRANDYEDSSDSEKDSD